MRIFYPSYGGDSSLLVGLTRSQLLYNTSIIAITFRRTAVSFKAGIALYHGHNSLKLTYYILKTLVVWYS